MRRFIPLLRHSSFIVAGALPATALAQTVESPAIERLPTVQVQAARGQRVADVDLPASISTVQLDDEVIGTLAQVSEALNGVPGLLARDRQNLAQDTQLSIRGFGSRSTFGVRGVRVLVDGVPATMPDGQGQLSHASLLSAQRIEVLRGPFSALYGNSSGGVVQVWSADGAAGDPWRARVAAGSDATVSAGAQLRGQQGPLRYNLAANHFETEGWREHSRARRESFNGRLGVDVGGGQLDLVVNYLAAPDAQDPLGLTRAQVNANPRHATAVATQYTPASRCARAKPAWSSPAPWARRPGGRWATPASARWSSTWPFRRARRPIRCMPAG